MGAARIPGADGFTDRVAVGFSGAPPHARVYTDATSESEQGSEESIWLPKSDPT
jgi:hypothetical protein